MKILVDKLLINLFLVFFSALSLLILFFEFVSNGPDSSVYKLAYESAVGCSNCKLEGQNLIISSLFYSFNSLGFEFETFLYVISFFFLLLKLMVVRYFVDSGWLVALLFYMTSVFWLQELIQFKLSIAFSFLMLAIYAFYIKDKVYLSLLLFGSSILAHTSIIFFAVTFIAFNFIKILRNYKILFITIVAFITYTLLNFLTIIEEQLLSYIINQNDSRIGIYLYDLIFIANESTANLFNIHVIYILLITFLYLLIRKNIYITNKILSCSDFLVFSCIAGILFKAAFLNSPVLAFRVFELLVAPIFIVQSLMITRPSRLPIIFRLFLFFVFLILNCYVYIFKNPIFIN